MKINFVDLKSQYHSIKAEIDKAILNVIEDTAFINGKYAESFENNFARYIGAKHCIGVGNGTDALYIALKALGIGQGDEVITAANSFIATSEAITMTGAKVVFVDCNDTTYNINTQKIANAITKKTKAIIPVHLYGHPADITEIMQIAKQYNLYVVEDSAQAHGARYLDQNIGTFGDFACFSFFPGKNLGAYGDAGALVTNNEDLAVRARMIANHGRVEKYNHEFEGVNSRLDGIQAAILDVKLKYLDQWTERRREIASKYDISFGNHAITPFVRSEVRHVYHLYVIRVNKRDEIRRLLADEGISTGIHYPLPLPFLKAYSYLNHKPSDFHVAYALKDEILSLPIHGSMKDNEVDYVVDRLIKILKKLDVQHPLKPETASISA